MRLRRLEITGFKSFAKRTVLELEDGITAIVGPNGSGKSNVAEAILWVTGQVQARQLRGQRQEDVIFAGSERLPPASFCEVEITFETGAKERTALGAEVSVARRVDRAGGSEVSLNGHPCRVRDLVLLFSGTGIGSHAYAFVGQGQVTSVLEGKPRDRKALVEEAAGVSLYRRYLEEIQKLLDRSRPLLARWEERLRVQEEALLPLEEQARRARLYRELREEVRRLSLGLARGRWERLAAAMGRLREEMEGVEGALWALEGERARLEAEEGRLWEALQSLRRRRDEGEEARRRLWREKEMLLSRLGELERQEKLWEEALERGKERRAALERMKAQWEARLAEASPSPSAGLEADLEKLKKERQALWARRQAWERERKAAEEALSQVETLLRRLEALRREREALSNRQAELEARLLKGKEALEAARNALEGARRERQAAQEEEARLQRELLSLTRQLGRLQGEREGYRARSFLAQGPRALLQARDEGVKELQGLLGTVAELLEVPPHLQRAVEAALGGGAEYLVATTGDEAEAAIGWLKKTGRGRATFLPLDQVKPPRLPEERALSMPGILGWLAEKVGGRAGAEAAIRHALGRTVLAEDLSSARAFARATGQRYRVVTLEGDLILPGGAMTGGSPSPGRSLLQQVERMRELEARYEGLKAEEEAGQKELARVQERKGRAQVREAQAEEEEREARRSLLEVEKELHAVARQGKALDEEEGALRSRGEGSLEDRRQEALGVLSRLDEERLRLEAETAELEAAWEKAQEAFRQQELAREKERLVREEARFRLERLQQELEEEEARAREAGRLLEKAAREREEGMRALEEKEGELKTLEEGLKAWEGSLEEAQKALDEVRQAKIRAEKEGRALEARRRQLEGELIRGDAELRHLLSRVRETFAVDERELSRVEPLEGEELERQLQEKQEALRALGGVDEGAIEAFEVRWRRYREEASRFQAYKEGLGLLETMAGRLERAVEEGYRETLQRVRARFRELFIRLFGGGHADLQEEEGDEGFSILASPPGKKTERLSLLSGGERSLVAIAFLFALLLENPPPFCLLDEVDAALDEANVERFTYLLRELSAHTQVLVITHQRGTMEGADRLIGITMGDSGVSQVVAVELRQEGDGDLVYVDGKAAPGFAEDPGAAGRPGAAAGGREDPG
ncbi:MAG: chromosome segregation protein SMC [Clostridiales bacterium]|nr:chromosome segregation protein SMC [Clostridiales bacterium]